MKIIKLAIKNILNRPLNLVLSIILFGLGIGLINFLILLNSQLKDNFDNNLADIDLVIGAKGSPLQMILSGMYHIDNPTGNILINEARAFLNPKHPLIKKSVPLSLGDNYRSFRIVGTTHGLIDLYNAELKEGSLFQKDLEVVIGAGVQDKTGLQIGEQFTSSHGFDDDDDLAHDHAAFTVVGVLKGTGSVIDQLILTNSSSVWVVHEHHEHEEDGHEHEHEHHVSLDINTNEGLLNHKDKEITNLLIQYKNKTNFQAMSMPRAINENTDMQAASPAIEINRLYSMIGVGTDMIRWLAIIIALVSAVSIFISLYKSMKERKYELAIMRVLGGGRNKIFQLILWEGIILSIIGFIVGFILSHVGLEILSKYLESSYRYSFTGFKFLNTEWIILGISILLGLVAALIPAIQAARTDINETLTSK